jgi:hypothetical protein
MRLLLINYYSCNFLSASAQQKDAAEPDKQAKEAVALIMKYTGLEPNFQIVEEEVKTANAYIKGSQRYVGI